MQRLRDLAYLADLVGVGIVRLTDELRVEVANTAAHVFLRRQPGAMVGHTAIEALGDHRVEAIARGAREAGWSSGEVALADQAGVTGATLVIRARRSPILGVWLVLEDVAELRRLQRIRAEFIDNLSHELRTPITTIGLLIEALTRDADGAEAALAPVPPKMRERIGKLEVETGNIAQMVAELLDLARIESGGRQLHLDDVNLGRVATESVDRLRTFADRQGVTLRTEIDPGLPPVRGEATRLAQVFANLVHNAVKFSPSGSEVRIRVARAPGARPAMLAGSVQRRWAGDLGGRPGPDLRALLQGGSHAHLGRGHGPRACHRAAHRRGPRRRDSRGIRGGQGSGLRVHDPRVGRARRANAGGTQQRSHPCLTSCTSQR